MSFTGASESLMGGSRLRTVSGEHVPHREKAWPMAYPRTFAADVGTHTHCNHIDIMTLESIFRDIVAKTWIIISHNGRVCADYDGGLRSSSLSSLSGPSKQFGRGSRGVRHKQGHWWILNLEFDKIMDKNQTPTHAVAPQGGWCTDCRLKKPRRTKDFFETFFVFFFCFWKWLRKYSSSTRVLLHL